LANSEINFCGYHVAALSKHGVICTRDANLKVILGLDCTSAAHRLHQSCHWCFSPRSGKKPSLWKVEANSCEIQVAMNKDRARHLVSTHRSMMITWY
jgi:hypothetical protein